MIRNVEIIGLESAIQASKYPMAVDVSKVSPEITERTLSLGSAPHGSGHDSFLKGVIVEADVTATIKFWVEWQRYHFSDIISSQSTMHRIQKFNIEESCIEYVSPAVIAEVKRLADEYNKNPSQENFLKLVYSVPVGLKLTARVSTNYLQLKTNKYQRKDHRLPEWRAYCNWMDNLPHFLELTEGVQEHEIMYIGV